MTWDVVDTPPIRGELLVLSAVVSCTNASLPSMAAVLIKQEVLIGLLLRHVYSMCIVQLDVLLAVSHAIELMALNS